MQARSAARQTARAAPFRAPRRQQECTALEVALRKKESAQPVAQACFLADARGRQAGERSRSQRRSRLHILRRAVEQLLRRIDERTERKRAGASRPAAAAWSSGRVFELRTGVVHADDYTRRTRLLQQRRGRTHPKMRAAGRKKPPKRLNRCSGKRTRRHGSGCSSTAFASPHRSARRCSASRCRVRLSCRG